VIAFPIEIIQGASKGIPLFLIEAASGPIRRGARGIDVYCSAPLSGDLVFHKANKLRRNSFPSGMVVNRYPVKIIPGIRHRYRTETDIPHKVIVGIIVGKRPVISVIVLCQDLVYDLHRNGNLLFGEDAGLPQEAEDFPSVLICYRLDHLSTDEAT